MHICESHNDDQQSLTPEVTETESDDSESSDRVASIRASFDPLTGHTQGLLHYDPLLIGVFLRALLLNSHVDLCFASDTPISDVIQALCQQFIAYFTESTGNPTALDYPDVTTANDLIKVTNQKRLRKQTALVVWPPSHMVILPRSMPGFLLTTDSTAPLSFFANNGSVVEFSYAFDPIAASISIGVTWAQIEASANHKTSKPQKNSFVLAPISDKLCEVPGDRPMIVLRQCLLNPTKSEASLMAVYGRTEIPLAVEDPPNAMNNFMVGPTNPGSIIASTPAPVAESTIIIPQMTTPFVREPVYSSYDLQPQRVEAVVMQPPDVPPLCQSGLGGSDTPYTIPYVEATDVAISDVSGTERTATLQFPQPIHSSEETQFSAPPPDHEGGGQRRMPRFKGGL